MFAAMPRRAIVLVLDGCGAGAAPDAAAFGDAHGPSTIRNVWNHAGGIHAPHLASIGFFDACGVATGAEIRPDAAFGRLQELSQGKDSVTGHWEMMGIVTEKPFPTYPEGFPIPLIKAFEAEIETQTLGNRPASGTVILDELGELHMQTGFPIVYTSADSVFQIACHEEIVPIEKLYDWCRIARRLCVEPDNVQRVIARPFVGPRKGSFVRTERRKDFPLEPPRNLCDEVGDIFGIGVVPELFGGRGFLPVRRTQNNAEHAGMLFEALGSSSRMIFANFEDFDMKYGHRNDPDGFARCLEEFDATMGHLLAALHDEDLLTVTADHGNDPTDASTDHTREYVPLCVVPSSPGGAMPDHVGMMRVGELVRKHLL